MESLSIGMYDEELDKYVQYDFDNSIVQNILSRYIKFYKTKKIKEENIGNGLDFIINKLDEITAARYTFDGIYFIKYLLDEVIDEVSKTLDNDDLSQALYGLIGTKFIFDIEEYNSYISYYNEKYNENPNYDYYEDLILEYEIERSRLIDIKSEFDRISLKDLTINIRTFMRVYRSFIENDGLEIFEIIKKKKPTQFESLKVFHTIANTIKGIDIIDESWTKLISNESPLVKLFNFVLLASGRELIYIPKEFEALLNKEIEILGKNFKYLIDTLAEAILRTNANELKYLMGIESPYYGNEIYEYDSQLEEIEITRYELVFHDIDLSKNEFDRLNGKLNNLLGVHTDHRMSYFYNQSDETYSVYSFIFGSPNLKFIDEVEELLKELNITYLKTTNTELVYDFVFYVNIDGTIKKMRSDEYYDFINEIEYAPYIYVDGKLTKVTYEEYVEAEFLYQAVRSQIGFKKVKELLTNERFIFIINEMLLVADDELKKIITDELGEFEEIVGINDVITLLDEVVNFNLDYEKK